MRLHRTSALVCVLLAAFAASGVARAAELYDVVGGLDETPLEVGAVANEVFVNATPNLVAAGPDGGLAFTVGDRIFWVAGGRIVRIARERAARDLVFAADGSLLVADGLGGVWRYDPEGRSRVAGRSDMRGSSGDRGPATRAALDCPSAIDIQADGGILVADGCAHRVRRIAPDSTITTVAGTGRRRGPSGDGGPATSAVVSSPQGVAALPDGGFAILEDRDPSRGESRSGHNRADTIRLVGPTGVIQSRRLTTPAEDLAAEPDGSVLLVLESPTIWSLPVWVQRLRADGTLEAAAGRRAVASIGFYETCYLCDAQPYAIASVPGGGFLVTVDGVVRYAPPASGGRLLAVAVAPATRVRRPHVEVAVRLTQPASVRVVVIRRGARTEKRLDLPAGETLVPFAELDRAGAYTVALIASADGRIATGYGETLVGRLPVSFAGRYLAGYFFRAPSCRRLGPWSVECREARARRCMVRGMRVLVDGRVTESVRRLPRRASPRAARKECARTPR